MHKRASEETVSAASGILARQLTALVPSLLLVALVVGLCARNLLQRCTESQRRALLHDEGDDAFQNHHHHHHHHAMHAQQQRALLLDLRALRQS